jgi:hypothetical protein
MYTFPSNNLTGRSVFDRYRRIEWNRENKLPDLYMLPRCRLIGRFGFRSYRKTGWHPEYIPEK